MNKPFNITRLSNGVILEFFDQGNRYFGDFHRIKINVFATIPFAVESLSADLQQFAATYPGYILYEKTLERMGVATSEVENVTHSLIDDFIASTGSYLEKKTFVEGLLRKNMTRKNQPERNRFRL
ncbi:MAG: hypothetical protein PF441_09595 [Desulfuromusa sp.]|jgi:hypothetical protein|nr:hypothetical protein [Desulfuromusa sp.]